MIAMRNLNLTQVITRRQHSVTLPAHPIERRISAHLVGLGSLLPKAENIQVFRKKRSWLKFCLLSSAYRVPSTHSDITFDLLNTLPETIFENLTALEEL